MPFRGEDMNVAGALKSVGYWLNPANLLLRSGIKVKLQLAFGAAALMTVVASAVAIISFQSTEQDIQRVAQRELKLQLLPRRTCIAVAGDRWHRLPGAPASPTIAAT